MVELERAEPKAAAGLNAADWFYYGEWQQPLLSAAFWVHWFDDELVAEMGLRNLDGNFVMLGGHSLPSKNDFGILRSRSLAACRSSDAAFYATLESVSQRVFSEALSFGRKLDNWQSFDSLALFEEFLRVEKRVMTPWFVSCVFSDVLGEELAEQSLALGFNPGEIVARIPRKETLVLKQYREALEIKEKIARLGLTPELREEIAAHVREFEWLGTHHLWGEPFSLEKFFGELPKLARSEPSKEQLPAQLDFLARAAGDAGILREYAAEVFNVAAFKARPLMTRAASQLGLSYDELLFLTPSEVTAFLRAQAKPEAALLEARKRFGVCVFVRDGAEIVVNDEKKLCELNALLLPRFETAPGELKGRGACPGRARGAVKIFLVPEGFEKMREGDVLVSPMTTPDFVPVMKRACAIVTDNGGLLSHAAIVSRELGIPCVVGTRQATRVLRDGDVVEVNGETGAVRKVEPPKSRGSN